MTMGNGLVALLQGLFVASESIKSQNIKTGPLLYPHQSLLQPEIIERHGMVILRKGYGGNVKMRDGGNVKMRDGVEILKKRYLKGRPFRRFIVWCMYQLDRIKYGSKP
jgi:hypothetical protein